MRFDRLKQAVWQSMIYNSNEARPYFTILGFILVIAYIGFYFFNTNIAAPNNYESFVLRLSVSCIGLGLILRQSWPQAYIKYEPIAFYFALLYSFPFFFSYMLFRNQESNIWHVNELIGLVLLTFFVDWISYIIVVALGVALAYIAILCTEPNFTFDYGLIGVFGSYSPPVIYFIIFAHKKKQLQDARDLYHQQIRRLNELLEEKVLERTLELEQAVAAKTEFLNNMSHEIRTPIQGFTNISAGLYEHWSEFDNSKRYELTSQIANNAKRLCSLVGNLLDLSKFSAGKMLFEMRQHDLNDLVEAIIDECNTLYINDKQIEIRFAKTSAALVIIDGERILQVLRNLFVNAIKLSPNNGIIIANITRSELTYDNGNKPEALHFTITDQGMGIPEAELETIFLAFIQGTRTKTKAGGTGLGLAIAKEIIEAHHGKIWARNNETLGATFEFVLPVTQSAQMDGHKIVSENNVIVTQEPIYNKPATILVVDDEEACLTSMELLLHGTKYKLVKASGGNVALDYLKAEPDSIDLIMLDLMMPDMYGLNVLAELKNDPSLCKIPVVLQSGTSDSTEIEKAYQLGIICYINKPYQKEVVLAEIRKLL